MRMLKAGEFYGTASNHESAGAVLSLVRHEKEHRLPDHEHSLPFLCLLLDGRYTEVAGDTTIEYEPLTLVYHPAKLAHRDSVFAGSRMFTVELQNRWEPVLAGCGAPSGSLYTHSGAEALWVVLRLYELFRTSSLEELTVESLLYELIGSFEGLDSSQPPPSAPWLSDLRAYLDGRFTEQISVGELARVFAVHPVHLSRSFRRAYKSNVGDYLHGRRIQHACRLLRESPRPILDVAIELGYFDQSHFNHIFRSFTGTTPARYRRSAP